MYPTLLHLGHLYLPTFGLLAALGLACAMSLSLRTAVLCALPPDALWNAGLFTILFAFVASRLLLVATNLRSFLAAPLLLLSVPSLTASGLFLTLLATLVSLRRRHLPLLPTLDAWAPPATLLWAFLAVGHLAEGSDPGLPTPHGLRTSLAGYREHPVALYAALLAFVFTAVLFRRLRRHPRPGATAALGLVLAGATQFLLTFLRLPFTYAPGSPFASLDPIQWVAFALLTAGCALFIAAATLPAELSPARHPLATEA